MDDEQRLERAAERFDALYTDLTVLQRELITARREGLEDWWALRDLIDRAQTISSAIETAQDALALNRPGMREVEAAALRERVLYPPINEHLLKAALKAQIRAFAYPLLAEALAVSAEDGELPAGVAGWTIREALSMPQAMGVQGATRLAQHTGFDPAAALGDLSPEDLARLCNAIRESADGLPEGVLRAEPRRRKGSPDGRGEAERVLES